MVDMAGIVAWRGGELTDDFLQDIGPGDHADHLALLVHPPRQTAFHSLKPDQLLRQRHPFGDEIDLARKYLPQLPVDLSADTANRVSKCKKNGRQEVRER